MDLNTIITGTFDQAEAIRYLAARFADLQDKTNYLTQHIGALREQAKAVTLPPAPTPAKKPKP